MGEIELEIGHYAAADSHFSAIRYDGAQFIQNWKTPSGSTDTCYRASVKFQDGSAIYAFFKLKK